MPVAVDQHIHRVLKNEEGKLFATILAQANRDLRGYSQGVYLFTPSGGLLEFANTADAGQVRRMLEAALRKFDPAAEPAAPGGDNTTGGPIPAPPEGGLVVTVTSRVLGGYEGVQGPRTRIHAASLGRDHLWVRRDEAEALARGTVMESLQRRIARFHLVDNTRGEPPFWRPEDVRRLDMRLAAGRLTGGVELESASGTRSYRADLLGFVANSGGRVTRFDLVARGDYRGAGDFTGGAPKGAFPFAVRFQLTDGSSEVDRALPGAARGSLRAYLQ